VNGTDRPAIRCRHLRAGNHNADKPVAGLSRKVRYTLQSPLRFPESTCLQRQAGPGLNGVTLLRVKREQSDA